MPVIEAIFTGKVELEEETPCLETGEAEEETR
jgi:hypothetical protein